MRKKNLLLVAACITFCLTACVNRISDDEDIAPPDDTKSELNIRTRTAVADLSPTLPVHIYAFDPKQSCVATQSLSTAEEEISMELPAGTYTVYALTGASAASYSLPTVANASPTAAINLLNAGSTHQELEAGNAAITLSDGIATDLMITVTRVVAQVTATITGLPDDITAVTVSLAPLHSGVKLNGTYEGDASSSSFSLEKGSGGEWHTPALFFILPGEGNATVTITLTNASGPRNYAYNSNIRIEANYKIEISANYTESTGPDINGSIKSTDWAGSRSITFDFGPGGTSGGGSTLDNLPAVGELYKDCYVLAITDVSAGSASLLLVSPHQWEGVTIENAADAVVEYSVNGISGWELPNRQQAELLFHAWRNISGMKNGRDYLFDDEDTMRSFSLADFGFNAYDTYAKTPYYVRGVKVERVSVE